jgi:hypothetical protein
MKQTRFLTVVALGALSFLVVPSGVQAALFLGGENLQETTEEVEGDLFVAANTVAVLHRVRDDIFAAGERVSIGAAAGGDIFAAGNGVTITGQPGDDILAAGNDIRISAPNADDVMAAGATVEITAKEVRGDVYAAGQNIVISGTIAGSVRAAGEIVRVAAGTTIGGDLITYGVDQPIIEDGVTVTGETRHHRTEPREEIRGGVLIAGWVRSVAAWFVAGLVLIVLLRGAAGDVVHRTLDHSGRSLGIGAVAAAVVLPACIILAITVVGLPLAFLVMFLTGAHVIAAHALAAVALGVWLFVRLRGEKAQAAIRWQHILLGVIVLKTVTLLPVIGWLAGLAITLMAWGALLDTLWVRLRQSTSTPSTEA